MKHILKCPSCNEYSLRDHCLSCNSATVQPVPAKFSPEDRYGPYRRQAKTVMLKEKGWL